MKKIGEFSKLPTGSYVGHITTLSVQARDVIISPVESATVAGPHFRVMVGKTEIGLGWRSASPGDSEVLRLEIDDPSFSAPILAELIDDPDGLTARLTWTR